MSKIVQNILVATLVMTAAMTASAQKRSGSAGSPGYYTGSSSYGSSVSYGYENEVITNFTNGSLITGKACKNCDSQSTINLNGAYLRTINAQIQAGALFGLQSVSGGTSETNLTLVALGVYNFDTNFKDAFFAQAGFGIYPVIKDSGVGHESKFGFLVGGGKRFALWDRITYMPTASLVKKGDLDIGIDIEFLNFSFMF